jgi:hypothetical protein
LISMVLASRGCSTPFTMIQAFGLTPGS